MKAFIVSLVMLFSVTVAVSASDDRTIVLDPVQVTVPAPEISVGIKVKNGLITEVVITEVRKGSLAERSGFSPGMEVVGYRGHPIIGISKKAFEALRAEPVVFEEISILYEIKGGLVESYPLAIHVSEAAREGGAPGGVVDRLTEDSLEADELEVQYYDFRLSKPINLKSASAKRKLNEAAEEIGKWQISDYRTMYREILWVQPVIKVDSMVAWRIAWRPVTFGLAEQLRVGYVPLSSPPKDEAGIENDLKESLIRSDKVKMDGEKIDGDKIALFTKLVDRSGSVLGVFVGLKAGQFQDMTDYYTEKRITSKESKQTPALRESTSPRVSMPIAMPPARQ